MKVSGKLHALTIFTFPHVNILLYPLDRRLDVFKKWSERGDEDKNYSFLSLPGIEYGSSSPKSNHYTG
jgi:hypothetical protein